MFSTHMKNNQPTFGSVQFSRNDLFLVLTAFIVYTGMYAVRKSFLAGQFSNLTIHGFDFKTLLVISQVLGYMLSKFIGIKIVSEASRNNKSKLLIGLVGFGLAMLYIFAILPLAWKPIALFLNGLPIGMVFGLVLSSLEGRKNTEILVAGLSATFIFSTGLVKTTGVYLLQSFSISEFYMPFATGLLFFPIFVLSVYLMGKCQPPSEKDILARNIRQPMMKKDRISFLKTHGWSFATLVIIYILLTIVRDFRDNFMVEFWAEMGFGDQPELITLTEVPIAIIVLIISAAGVLILNNKIAFEWGLYAIVLGAAALIGSTLLFKFQLLSPVSWMIISGLGVYLPYILYHCLIFERFMALLKFTGTISFLFYVADALGYMSSVGILISKELLNFNISWINFFTQLNIYMGLGILIIPIFFLVFQFKAQSSTTHLNIQ